MCIRHLMISSENYYSVAVLILLWGQIQVIKTSVNLALNKSTSQSSTWLQYPSSIAVDGNYIECRDTNFTHTDFERNAWWQVDLGEMCEIKYITIYYRPLDYARLDGYSINITKSFNPLDTWQCFKDMDDKLPSNFTPSHICQGVGQYVTFSRQQINDVKAVVHICEFEVYGCPVGRYGSNCSLECSRKCGKSRCDPDNGKCYYGDSYIPCSKGCQENKCDLYNGNCVEGCKTSLYGTFCNITCPKKCNDLTCESKTGKCIGCKPGFYGDDCSFDCPVSCKENICEQIDGRCTSCEDNFTGNNCTECVDGYYGKTCISCPNGCVNMLCKKDNGFCQNGCRNSFFGIFCNISCPDNCKNNKCDQSTGDCSEGCRSGSFLGKYLCVNGVYGNECDKECPVNCKYEMCHGSDGSCVFGCKQSNMSGNQCDGFKTTDGKVFQINSYIGWIIGGVLSLINIVLIVIIIMMYLKRHRDPDNRSVYENQIAIGSLWAVRNQQENNSLQQQQTFDYETVGTRDRSDTNTVERYTTLDLNEEHIQ